MTRAYRHPDYVAVDGMKRCRKCEESQSVSEYYSNKTSADGYQSVCKACFRVKARANYYANREKIIERVRIWQLEHPERTREIRRQTAARRRAADPEAARARERAWRAAWSPEKKHQENRRTALRRYGLAPDQYDELLSKQNGRCAICDGPPNGKGGLYFHVDHCHTSGEVRGLLCHYCNTAIGSFRDDPALLRRAIAYLEG